MRDAVLDNVAMMGMLKVGNAPREMIERLLQTIRQMPSHSR